MGSSPKPPPPAPDPRIAEEESRREGIAIGQLERQRRSRSGASSTILGGAQPGTTLTRPTQDITYVDPSSTSAAKKQADINEMSSQIAAMPTSVVSVGAGDEAERRGSAQQRQSGTSGAKTAKQAELEVLRESISPAELQVLESAKKQKNIAEYIGRTRSRLGVTATRGS